MNGKTKQIKRNRPASVDWKELNPVPEFDGYFITQKGKLFSVTELTPFEDEDGYVRVNMYRNGKIKRPAVHNLLAKTFLPLPKAEQTLVRHLDGNKKNLDLANLAWGTQKDNGEDKARHGSVKGEKNPKAKLTAVDVAVIKKLLQYMTIREVADKFPSVSQSTIEAISCGQNWKHIKPAD